MTQATTMNVYVPADNPTPAEVKVRDQDIFNALASNHSGDADVPYALVGMLQYFPTAAVLKLHNGAVFAEMLTPASAAPATSAATGTKGQFWLHATGIDICVATDTWLRFSGAGF